MTPVFSLEKKKKKGNVWGKEHMKVCIYLCVYTVCFAMYTGKHSQKITFVHLEKDYNEGYILVTSFLSVLSFFITE